MADQSFYDRDIYLSVEQIADECSSQIVRGKPFHLSLSGASQYGVVGRLNGQAMCYEDPATFIDTAQKRSSDVAANVEPIIDVAVGVESTSKTPWWKSPWLFWILSSLVAIGLAVVGWTCFQ